MSSVAYKLLFVFIIVGLSFVACERNKKSNQLTGVLGDPYETKMIEDGFTRCVVSTEFSKDGCPFVLKSSINGEVKLLLPLQLREDCQIEGKVIFIKYRPSRAPQPAGCATGSLITLDDIQFQ